MAFNNRRAKRGTYVRNLQIHGAIGVQDIVEETAVVVVAGEFGLKSSLVFQRGGGGGQLGLKVVGLGCTVGHGLIQLAHSIVEVDLLAVVVDHSLLLIIGLIVQVGARIGAVFVGHVEYEGGKKRVKNAARCRDETAVRKRKGAVGRGWDSVGVCDLPKKSNFEGFRLGVCAYLICA
jgi:hypothetical protein